ncbi:hypothetical protein AM587_10011005 [Phytophthora nicotianae]|uniref:Telomere replication protein EST3 n=1 Tax=Phytophthora nicotianae TaxID=4792 RepID=A0A0W8D867_PHYNI|nr:hypothetical protein AM587_10011005 [Phytophthora nicotianae]
MPPRSSFATEFLLRELLSALGAPLIVEPAPSDSFSESLSEDTEPQSAANGVQSRVMLVRRTNSSQQTATLVDREYDVEAFIPSHVSAALQKERGYQTLGRLRGSVVRVTKYYFATMARCLSADKQNRQTSVSAPNVGNENARVYLWIDALAIVEDNELAVQPHPEVYSHPLVEERLQTLSDTELEKQLMINQGLPPLTTAASDRFDDDRPLLEEDCVIPEDQEQELEEQDEWGPPPTTSKQQPTDSQLIEENGSQENIQETYVVDSDVDGNDTEDDEEHEETKNSTPSRTHSSADFNPTPAQNSSAIVDLTEDSPEKPTPQPAKKQAPAKRWGGLFASFFGSGSTKETNTDEEEDSTKNDEQATQILDPLDKAKEEVENEDLEDKFAPEEFMPSQATVVLQYAIDNDEDANAFEYDGMASPRSVVHEHDGHTSNGEQTDLADDLTLPEEGIEVAATPQKKSLSQKDNAGFKTPSPSAHASTPGTEKRAEETPTISTGSQETPARDTNCPVSPPSSKDPVLPTDPAGQLSPVKSPSKLVISVGSAGRSSHRPSHTGFSSAGSKRRHLQTNSEDPSPATSSEQDSALDSNVHNVAQSRSTQKRRRRDILSTQEANEAGSQSPQFEQPAAPVLPRRRLQADCGTVVTDSYSLGALCRSLGSNARDQPNENTQTRSGQPRRAWKRYENLFPPLNMTRLKQMMAEANHK